MSQFACPHCGATTDIFGSAGGQRIADEYGVPLLARLPLDPETRRAGDAGTPITISHPESAQASLFAALARAVMKRLDDLASLAPLPTIS